MIKLVESENELYCGFSGSLFARIAGTASAYGCAARFALFWRQLDEVGNVTALLCSFDGNATLAALDTADFDELKAFLPVCGVNTLLCSLHTAERMGLEPVEICRSLKFKAPDAALKQSDEFSLEELYSLLKSGEDGQINMPEHDAWYADMSHRLRHSAAEVFALRQDEKLVSSAVSLVSRDLALISGVAVAPGYRRKGLGKCAVAGLANKLKTAGYEVFVMAREDVTPFYINAGFKLTGKITQILL